MGKRLTAVFVLIWLLPAVFASAQTATSTPDLESIVNQLQEQIKSLRSQILELQSQLETVKTELKFTKALQRGASGDEVRELQEFLKKFPDIYPQGLVTGYFGPVTEAAVKRFQEKLGLESIGVVGPRTRAKLNELITEGAGASGVIPPGLLTAPGLQRERAAATPAVPTLPIGGATTTVPPPPNGAPQATSTASIPFPLSSATSATSSAPAAIATATPSGAIPATPATPAVPSSGAGTSATPAVPATPATPPPPSPTTATTTVPAVPSSFGGSAGGNTVSLWWTDNSTNETSFEVYRQDGIGGTWRILTQLGSNITSYADTLTVSNFYTYRVRACNAAGCSGYSGEGGFNVTVPLSFITVLSPNGGETWTTGQSYAIRWSAANVPADTKVGLQLSYRWNTILQEDGISTVNLDPAAGTYQWTIPTQYGSGYEPSMFKVHAYLYGPNIPGTNPPQDYSDATFTITMPAAATTDCTVTFKDGKTTYVISEIVMYTYTCTVPAGGGVTVKVVNPSGVATTYNSGGSSGIQTQTLGFGTTNLSAGNYTLQVCTSACMNLPFTMVQNTGVPPIPLNLTATMASYSTTTAKVVALLWSGSTSGITEFRIFSRPQGSTWPTGYERRGLESLIGNIGAHIGLVSGASGVYEFKVQACNSAGCSADSNAASVDIGGTSRLPAPSTFASVLEAISRALAELQKLLPQAR